MTGNLSVIISSLVAFQLLFISIFLITHKKGNKRNNRLLGVIFLLFALNLIDFTLRISGYVFPIQVLHLIDDGFFFIYGPLLYFYVQGVVYVDFKFRIKDLFHLIPILIYSLFILQLLLFADASDQNQMTEKIVTAKLPVWMYMTSLLIYIYIFSYLWQSQRVLNKYQAIIKNKFSSVDKINLDWLGFIIRSFFVITLIAMVHNIVPAFGSILPNIISLIILVGFTFFFANRVLVRALNQPAFFSGIERNDSKKYAGSNMTEEKSSQYKEQLVKALEKDKAYLNAELSVKELAGQLQTTPKILSQIINQTFNKNFYDLINSYRCEEVKRILQGPDEKVTILEALYKAGFNSKSSFNKEFKKLTGQTPTEFKKSIT